MKNILKHFAHRAAWLALLLAVGWLVVPKSAISQSSGSYVDECSSGDNFPIEYSGCIYGSVSTGLTAYQESDLVPRLLGFIHGGGFGRPDCPGTHRSC